MTDYATGHWFITGASTGIGREIANEVLARGGKVTVTARDLSRLEGFPKGAQVLPLALDLTQPDTFPAALKAAEKAFGPVDVLANNAGYGLLGAVEESSDAERRHQMEANFFGPVALTTLFLAGFRERRRGAIITLSSTSGVRGIAGSSYYSASKHALEGWSSTLRIEMAPFGVPVMIVEPSGFRTDFSGRSRVFAGAQLGVYANVDKRRDEAKVLHGNQNGDPVLGAKAIITAIEDDKPPRWLAIGKDAVKVVRTTANERLADVDRFLDLAESADSPA